MATIKAGTYRFKDNPAIDVSGKYMHQLLTFTSNNNIYKQLETGLIVDQAGYGMGYLLSSGGDTVQVYSVSSTGVPISWANDNYKEITLATDQSVSDEFYTWFSANIIVNLHDQIEQHIQDAYIAIGSKSGTIPTNKNLQNLKSAIESISTGIDTSNATATSADILKDKTAYVKGAKVTGTIETYDGTVEDVVKVIEAGTYKWANNPDLSIGLASADFNFTSNAFSFNRVYVMPSAYDAKIGYTPRPQYIEDVGWNGSSWGYVEDGSWYTDKAYQTITLSTDQQVDTDFYEWAITGGNLLKQ